MKQRFVFSLLFCLSFSPGKSQVSDLPKPPKNNLNLVKETFIGTRMINFQTVETQKKKCLNYRIMHRFGDFNSKLYGFFGLDGPATINMQIDYGITDKFTVSIGRAAWDKMYQFSGKYKILQQTTDNKMPVTVTAFAKMNITTLKAEDAVGPGAPDPFTKFGNRIDYFTQVMIARRFGERIGVQVSPAWIHYNSNWRAASFGDPSGSNDVFAACFNGSYKVSKKFAVTLEYSHTLNKYINELVLESNNIFLFDHIGAGIDVRAGGHVFSFFLSNTFQIDEIQAIPLNFKDFTKGAFRIGFNIQRDFQL